MKLHMPGDQLSLELLPPFVISTEAYPGFLTRGASNDRG
jgi:hypothetical protein